MHPLLIGVQIGKMNAQIGRDGCAKLLFGAVRDRQHICGGDESARPRSGGAEHGLHGTAFASLGHNGDRLRKRAAFARRFASS